MVVPPLARGLLLTIAVAALGCGDIPPAITDGGTDGAGGVCSPTCDVNATCSDGTCGCNAGYMGTGTTCDDINECATNNGGCDVHAECLNRPGSFVCRCSAGYVGDGQTCQPLWEMQASLSGATFESRFYGHAASTGGPSFFFVHDGDGPNTTLYGYDTRAMTFSAKPVTGVDDFCACGYTQTMVGGNGRLYMYGNSGWTYDPPNDRWTQLNFYPGSGQHRGEAAGAFDPGTGRTYVVAGRDNGSNNSLTAGWIDSNTGAEGAEPGVIPVSLSQALAWIPPMQSTMYVGGGYGADSGRRHFFRHNLGTASWETLPDVPDDVDDPRGMGHYQGGFIWIASATALHLYDAVSTGTWRSISVPPGFEYAVWADDAVWAISSPAGANRIDIYKLVRTQ